MTQAFHHVLSRLNQAAHGPQEGRKTDLRSISVDDLRQLLDDWNRLDDSYRAALVENNSLRGNCKAMGYELSKKGARRIAINQRRKDAEHELLRENMQGWLLLAQDRALQVLELEALLAKAHPFTNDVAHDVDVWLEIEGVLRP